ncbi:hypothetical protein [Nonomuraea gerenzanensis]|uniref:Uncharacterized protein n=1 Tax=Nonomuraea gerenzanensis TaxID=93944 RepID=A0A1M4E5Q4_9ACTN|nr:hypothetical protein [Nonomuraea gerenzanensis]UBU16338.1 hypothetical protein LCN96_15380 [Nonomuraea gerenzanensis]SBO94157.1 hypothetical protein BN4615_P3673 [Nonomuraea gerenzanensis]
MKLINDHLAVKARLLPTTGDGFVVLAGETGTWRGHFPSAPIRLAARLKALAADVEAREATVFRAVFRTPGEGDELLTARGIHPARYDVVVLIRTASVEAALAVRGDAAYQELAGTMRSAARRTHEVVASNAGRLGDVDHGQDHYFLFNYFYADDRATLLKVWEYTAGWFQAKTALPDSALMRPLEGEPADYGLINHASWPTLGTFLPSLIFRPTFRRFVLANFKANGIAAQPIIYRRV